MFWREGSKGAKRKRKEEIGRGMMIGRTKMEWKRNEEIKIQNE
jgi:hypothetical protein